MADVPVREAPRLQMSLADVALLARVQRPVASIWRTRAADSDLPFPEPVARVGIEERFDVERVVEWLEATGRGRNPDARADAAAHSAPAGLSLRDPALFAGLTALLCVKAMTGADLADSSTAAIIDLATAADPEDTFLRAEISAVEQQMPCLAAYADAISEAAYGPAAALERLLDQRFRQAPAEIIAGTVMPSVRSLCSRLAASLARDCALDPPVYVSATGGSGDVITSLASADDGAAEVLLLQGTQSDHRLSRRRLQVLGLPAETTADLTAAGAAVVVAHHPVEALGTSPRERALDAIDELALTLRGDQRALVLAPASLLTDRLGTRQLQQLRARILRTGRVRGIVRLPAGLVPHRSREALALWVLTGKPDGVPVEDRRIALADVSGVALDDFVVDQLRDDVLAALAPPSLIRARSFALSRLVAASAVLAQSGPLIAPGVPRAAARVDGREAALRIERLRSRGNASDPLGGVAISVVEGRGTAPVTVAQAVEQGLVRVIAGNRHVVVPDPDGTLPVIGVPELSGAVPAASRFLDRLAFLGSQAAARLTEPGDVVFCTSPRPRALVDCSGGSAVEFPARILRIDMMTGDALSPDVVVQGINSRTNRGEPWRSWFLPRVEPGQAAPLTSALGALAEEQEALRQRLDELDRLRDDLVNAVTAGALALAAPEQKDRSCPRGARSPTRRRRR
jgi:hypothetical protein